MKILMKLLLDKGYPDIVDECQFWVNTTDFEDLQWLKSFSRTTGLHWVRLKSLPAGAVMDSRNLWWTVCKFYGYARDPNTIYVKIDDDTVLIDSLKNFEKFLDFRIQNPQHFLISANVLNNSICTYFMQSAGLLSGLKRISCDSHDKSGMSGIFAESLHKEVIKSGFDLDRFHINYSPEVAEFARVCINCISWFGEDMADLEEIPKEDEIFLSMTVPCRANRSVCIYGEYTVCHFGYGSQQRHLMENTDLLDRYHRNAFFDVVDGDVTLLKEKLLPREIQMR